MLLGRTNRHQLHCFLQRTNAVHPRRKSAARQGNMEQRRPAGICLPKTDVMLDMVLICTGQSQDRRRGSTQNCRMKDEAHITRLPPTTTTYILAQCCRGISLPLIPITRLPPATTRHTGTTKYARGLLYFTNYHVHNREGFNRMSNG